MIVSEYVDAVVERAVGGEKIPAEELGPLFSVPAVSPEAALVRWAAREITARACGGVGQIYAQIGIDALPCPADCGFCSFAASLSRGIGDAVVPVDEVARYARAFDEAGVHLVSLMATAALPFEAALDAVRAVRAAVSDDMPILANLGDVTAEQAAELRREGVQAAYHANRIGEGSVTRIAPETRRRTLRALQDAGLKIMSAVEPVHEGVPMPEILARMEEVASFRPYCAGVGTLTNVPGSAMEHVLPPTRAKAALYAAIFRLMVGEDVPFGTGGGNVAWTDAGTSPRARDLARETAELARDVRRLRMRLSGDEWEVPARPLPGWFS